MRRKFTALTFLFLTIFSADLAVAAASGEIAASLFSTTAPETVAANTHSSNAIISETSATQSNTLKNIASKAIVSKNIVSKNMASKNMPPETNSPKTILIYGDSISAAYGIEREQGWVALLATYIQTNYPAYKVVNASVSGETTGGGLIRLPKSLEVHRPDIIILELGGNDGLRGYPISKISGNLQAMIQMSRSRNTTVLLVGMILPPNYGQRYTNSFSQIFVQLADQYQLPFLPFLLDGVTTERTLIQNDGIHPTAEAQSTILVDVLSVLKRLLNPEILPPAG